MTVSQVVNPASLRPDPRLTLALAAEQGVGWDLADIALEGRFAAARYVTPEPMQVVIPACGLRRAPDASAEQVDQLLFGERFEALTPRGDFVFGQARRDGYVGWAPREALSSLILLPTHWVRALRTYIFPQASIKTPPRLCLSTNALVTLEAIEGRFAKLTQGGWIPSDHLAALGQVETDPAAIALRYLGAPYLWGGRDSVGLDCSGLVQQALYACGRSAPRDSDMQARLGEPVDGREGLARNDLVFWRGHVGLMLDGDTLIHANAFHMAVAVEPLDEAIARISAAGGGDPTAFRRLAGIGPRTASGAP
jgi:cell wall-associated NlpC family hydrolase